MAKDMIPKFNLQDIQISVGDKEFNKGLELYKNNSVKNITGSFKEYTATVVGTSKYNVVIDSNSFDRGNCNCFLGQKDILCKHMIALAIAVVYTYKPDDMSMIATPLDRAVCSGEIREISEKEIEKFKLEIKNGMSHIKSYSGPSSKWFQYQNSLIIGSRIILLAVSRLPVCEKSALLCINLLKRLDKKLLGPVDDSDGTVGELMCQIVVVLNMFSDSNPELKQYIKNKMPKGESFDWESGFNIF